MSDLTHFDADGRPHMVDVSGKADTVREAVASGEVRMEAATLAVISGKTAAKGDVLAVAELAGIMAAKRTSDLIPLCHPLALSSVDVALTPDVARNVVTIRARVRTRGATGVEMEALTAVSIAALTVYDMVKAIDRGIEIGPVRLEEKHGGKSGAWSREA